MAKKYLEQALTIDEEAKVPGSSVQDVGLPVENGTAPNTQVRTTASSPLQQVEADRQAALSQNEQLYGGMISGANQVYEEQQKQLETFQNQQNQLLDEQTDFAIEQIEQQKQQAQEDYEDEQSAAWVDYRKQSAKHGVNEETMAAAGMTGTGYSESSKVAMYTAYQNRVAVARETVKQAIVAFDNAITEAKLTNDSAKAEIALNTLQMQLELALESFQYQNELLLQMANQKLQIESLYDSKYQNVLDEIYRAEALAEEQRQFDASLEEEQRQFDLEILNQGGSVDLTGGGTEGADEGPALDMYSVKRLTGGTTLTEEQIAQKVNSGEWLMRETRDGTVEFSKNPNYVSGVTLSEYKGPSAEEMIEAEKAQTAAAAAELEKAITGQGADSATARQIAKWIQSLFQ